MRPNPLLLCAALTAAGCTERVLPEPDFERMVRQDKYEVWEACEFFDDGRAMQEPPEGTVPRDRVTGRPGYTAGVDGGDYVKEIPIPLSRELLQRGRQQYEVYCAPCHGVLGDGNSRVATNMTLRRPPSLVDATAQALPVGRIYQVVEVGYGLMPSYADEIPAIEDRWAVVAYLQALQVARGVPLAALPPPLRARAEKELK